MGDFTREDGYDDIYHDYVGIQSCTTDGASQEIATDVWLPVQNEEWVHSHTDGETRLF